MVPDSMPHQFATLMEHCWATQPEERPTAQQVLEALQHLMQQLPADMAATAAGQQQQQQPDPLGSVQSMQPALFSRAPRKQQQRLKARQRSMLLAATASQDDVRENQDTLLLEEGQQGLDHAAASATPAVAGCGGDCLQDQLERCRSEQSTQSWGAFAADGSSRGYHEERNAVV
jgi:hypothetical protein